MTEPASATPIRASHVAAAKLSVAAAHKQGKQPPEWVRSIAASSPQRARAHSDQPRPSSDSGDIWPDGTIPHLPLLDDEHDFWLEIFGADSPTGGIGDLTVREVEVLKLVADGLTDRQIAQRFHLAEKVVRNHVDRIYTKLDVSSRSEAARLGAGLRLS